MAYSKENTEINTGVNNNSIVNMKRSNLRVFMEEKLWLIPWMLTGFILYRITRAR